MKKVILASVLSTVAMTSMVDANAATSGVVCAAPTSCRKRHLMSDLRHG
jgi:hypothetical protein